MLCREYHAFESYPSCSWIHFTELFEFYNQNQVQQITLSTQWLKGQSSSWLPNCCIHAGQMFSPKSGIPPSDPESDSLKPSSPCSLVSFPPLGESSTSIGISKTSSLRSVFKKGSRTRTSKISSDENFFKDCRTEWICMCMPVCPFRHAKLGKTIVRSQIVMFFFTSMWRNLNHNNLTMSQWV